MSLRVASNLDELSRKFEPQTFNRQYVNRIAFRGFQFVNPGEEPVERLLSSLGRDPVFLKISLRRRREYDNAYLLLVGNVVCAAYYEEDGRSYVGAEAITLFIDGFKKHESGVVEIYDLDGTFAEEIKDEIKGSKDLSEVYRERAAAPGGPAPAAAEAELAMPPSLDEVRARVEEAVNGTCSEYGYKVDSLKTLVIGDSVIFEVKVSPKSILRRTKIGREELVVKLWNSILPILARHGIIKAKVRVRWGILTYEHP